MSVAGPPILIFKNTRDLVQERPGEGVVLAGEAGPGSTVHPRTGVAGQSPTTLRQAAPPGKVPAHGLDAEEATWPFSQEPERGRARSAMHHAGGLHRILREVRGSAEAIPHWLVGTSYKQDVRLAVWRKALTTSSDPPEQVLRRLLAPVGRKPSSQAVRQGRSHARWTPDERTWLYEAVAHGRIPPFDAAAALGRSESAVVSQALRMFDRDTVRSWCGGIIDLPGQHT